MHEHSQKVKTLRKVYLVMGLAVEPSVREHLCLPLRQASWVCLGEIKPMSQLSKPVDRIKMIPFGNHAANKQL